MILVGSVPSCLRGYFVGPKFFLLGNSWVPKFFLWVCVGSEFFSRGCFVVSKFFSRRYFVGSKFFLLGISWVPNFFLWVFVGSKFFSRAHLVGPKFFLVGIRAFEIFLVGIYGSESFPLGYFMSPVFFSSCVFRGFNFFFLWLIS